MFTLICVLLMLGVMGEIIGFAFKAAWGIGKVLFTLIFLPVIVLFMIFMGLIYLAIPALLVIGIIGLVKGLSHI